MRRSSSSFVSEREELLELLLSEGIRRESSVPQGSSEEDGEHPWKLDSLGVTLSSRGAELAGQCLLQLLGNFEGRQLATFGTTGIPILQSCVLLSKGKYRGLLVRKETSGGRKAIEGRVNPSEPVIIVTDSVGLETWMEECTARLEEAGLRVEGGVCLVRFGYDSAFARMQARGYRMLALYDIWNDLVARMPEEEQLVPNPTRVFPQHELSSEKAPEGLHPAELARRVIDEALRTGKFLRPPRRIQGRYSGAGGVRVSVRSKSDPEQRHTRTGFWSFPEEKALSLPVAIGEAAFLAANALKEASAEPLALLEQSAIAVTFCSALEECEVGQLDNERYGLVVRSRERPFLMGGAMPRMPGIHNEWEQLESARTGKARLLPYEPFILYRFNVQKAVEPGTHWPSSSVPVEDSPGPKGASLPARISPKSLQERVTQLTQPLCKFLLRHLGETSTYEPLSDEAHTGLDTARLAHQAWTVARAHRLLGPAPLQEGAQTLLAALTSDLEVDSAERVWIRSDGGTSISEVALVLLTLLETGNDDTTAATLATTLWSSIGAHGRFACQMDPAFDDDAFQDSYPGQALLALAVAAQKKVCAPDKEKLSQARRYYRDRFRLKRNWGQVCWLPQAAVAWWRVDRDAEAARLAFEICDWALTFQSEKTGAFLNDHQPDTPGYTTAFYLQALAAGAELAAGLRDRARHRRYVDAYARGVAFLDSLIFQERDTPLLPNPRRAIGGVRTSLVKDEVRVDAVQHALAALLSAPLKPGSSANARRRRARGR